VPPFLVATEVLWSHIEEEVFDLSDEAYSLLAFVEHPHKGYASGHRTSGHTARPGARRALRADAGSHGSRRIARR
jgi:hypothetical protein